MGSATEKTAMTEAEITFELYMDEVIVQAGSKGKRRHIWSITRTNMAREVLMDCMERKNVAGSRKCPAFLGSRVSD